MNKDENGGGTDNDVADNENNDIGYRERAAIELEKRIAEFEKFLDSAPSRSAADNSKREKAAPRAEYPEEMRKPNALDPKPKGRAAKLGRKSVKITNIHAGHRERMRQTVRRDPTLSTLSDIEVLEYVLAHAVPYKDTNPIAHALLDKFGSLYNVMHAPEQDLLRIPSMTRNGARLLTILADTVERVGVSEMRGALRSDVLSFVMSLYLGGSGEETFAVFFGSAFDLLSIEKIADGAFGTFDSIKVRRAVVGSVTKYCARYVLIASRDNELFPSIDGLSGEVTAFKTLLDTVGAKLVDYLVVCDYGYYTLGSSAVTDIAPEFVFMPLAMFARSPELAASIAAKKADNSKHSQALNAAAATTDNSDNTDK